MAGCGRRAAVRLGDSGPGRPSVWRWGWRRRWSGRSRWPSPARSAWPTSCGRRRGGLLATSPAVYVSVIGLLLLFRVDRALAAVGLTLLALTTLHVSAHAYWWSSAWPAPVAFLALTPYFVCGAAAVVDAVGRAVARRPVPRGWRAAGSLRGLEPHVDEGRRRRQLRLRRAEVVRRRRRRASQGPARLDRPSAVDAGQYRLRRGQRRSPIGLRPDGLESLAGRRGVRRRDRHRRARCAVRRRRLAWRRARCRAILPVGDPLGGRGCTARPRRRSGRGRRRPALPAAGPAAPAADAGRQRRSRRRRSPSPPGGTRRRGPCRRPPGAVV